MHKSKMIELLSFFSSKELGRFGEFLVSPFFNKDEEVVLFFKYIKPYGPEFTSNKLEKTYLLNNGIPGLTLTEKKLGYLMNYIIVHAESFIKLTHFSESRTEGNIHLLKKFNSWGADKFFEKTLNKIQSENVNQEYKDADHLLNQYLLASESTHYFDRQKVRSYDPSLQNASDYLDLFYISTKLKYLCELMNRQQLVAAKYEMRLLEEIFAHVKDKKYEEFPSVTIYYQILMLYLETEIEDHYFELKKLIYNNIGAFTPTEARDILTYAQNYCITKANNGKQEFLHELFQLYKLSIEKKFILTDGNISPWAFKNIVSVATRVEETNWAEVFIKENIQFVNTRFQENAYNYNYAYLLYSKKQYGEALMMLNSVEYTDVFYALDSRVLQIKLYYDMQEIPPLLSSLDSFRVYLRRNKIISEKMKTVYSNFIKYTDKAIRYANNKPKLKQLGEELKENKLVADINWLLLKLNCNIVLFFGF